MSCNCCNCPAKSIGQDTFYFTLLHWPALQIAWLQFHYIRSHDTFSVFSMVAKFRGIRPLYIICRALSDQNKVLDKFVEVLPFIWKLFKLLFSMFQFQPPSFYSSSLILYCLFLFSLLFVVFFWLSRLSQISMLDSTPDTARWMVGWNVRVRSATFLSKSEQHDSGSFLFIRWFRSYRRVVQMSGCVKSVNLKSLSPRKLRNAWCIASVSFNIASHVVYMAWCHHT